MLKCKGSHFFNYIGDSVVIRFVILKNLVVSLGRETENTQLAYVTFKDSQGADTAVLLSVCSLFCNGGQTFVLIFFSEFFDAVNVL